MKCSKCGKNNVTQATYCKWCGKKFTKEEKDLAINSSLPSKINKVRDMWDKLTLSKYTDTKIFKVLFIVFILVLGFLYISNNGSRLKLLGGEDYYFDYNKNKDEYYVYITSEEANLYMYFPKKTDRIFIKFYPYYGDYSTFPVETMSLDSNGADLRLPYRENGYYLISLDDTFKKKRETIKVYTLTNEIELYDDIEGNNSELILPKE